ncbi:conjugal transfer protein TraY [Herbaspirillum rubrisubalbicans Os34]|uniref:Conjugal transfer protein TraY n=1 Tax=Herbaspirillum rubrisubalbicans Os34 TaxID=1235827 RepID=A0A6M3ZVD0_9BURK|nr:DotA/TraY family protein [Herbaspirillum rubrisubalbicans]QJQ02321.1 conjugal transfer protein TraY [Herbaspirillum rubrisubalbicans Os34]
MKRLLAAFAIYTLASSALAGAESGTIAQFTPPPGDTSVDFLREVFGDIVGLISSGGKASAAPADTVLGSMMAIFNTAVLFVGMLFVGYTTVKGTVDSAHDGELLGRKMSSIWIPLRTVGGTALLLPLGSGFSLIQIGILWLALQGVGIADKMWNAAIDQMSRDNMISRPMIPDSRPLAANILRFEVCAAAMNKQYSESGRATRIEAATSKQVMMNSGELLNYDVFDLAPPVAMYTTAKNFSNATYSVTKYTWNANDNSYINKNVCGGVSWKQSYEASEGNSNTKVLKEPILAAHAAALQAMIKELQPVANQIVTGDKPTPGAIDTAANNYENTLRTAAKNAVNQTNDRARSDFLTAAKDGGWIYAGTWYNHIVKMNDVMQSTLNGLPTSDPIAINDKETQEVLQTYKDAMAVADEYAKHRSDSVRQVYYTETDVRLPQAGEGAWDYARKLLSTPFMGGINQMTQEVAGSNLNHMSQMKSFGDTIVGIGEGCLAAMAGAAGVANSVIAKGTVGLAFDVGAVLQVLSGVVTTLAIALFFFGVVLSTYIPMIPFITWMTSVVNWFVLVLESVIAGPLFAVAHIHPDGDDAVGKAGPGWMMILSLVMRPSLMLFGLIGSMLLTQPVTGLINGSFMSVVAGVQADSTTGIVSLIAFITIYATLMTTVVHLVFSLIHFIPDNIMRWLGQASGALAGAERAGEDTQHIFAGGVREARHGLGGAMGGIGTKGPEKLPPSGHKATPSNKDLLGD